MKSSLPSRSISNTFSVTLRIIAAVGRVDNKETRREYKGGILLWSARVRESSIAVTRLYSERAGLMTTATTTATVADGQLSVFG